MNESLYGISLGGFLLLPAILVGIRFVHPSRMPWWAVVFLLTGGGWLLVNGTVYFYYEHLSDTIRSHPNPSAKLFDRLNADGAKYVLAWYFGWICGPVYSAPSSLFSELLPGCGAETDGCPLMTPNLNARRSANKV